MLILGLNAFHADSAACILRDGTLVAAAEEERFRRVKHWAGFPSQAIAYCLKEAGATPGDVDAIALNQDDFAHLAQKIAFVAMRAPNPRLVLNRIRNRAARAGLPGLLRDAFPGESFAGRIHRVEHHVAHLASAFYVSPFAEAAALSIDGFGDFASAAWGEGRGGDLSVTGRVFFPHSLGILYQAVTQYLGFPHYGDEYKVMGLAPYGTAAAVPAIRRLVELFPDGRFALDLAYFRHHRDNLPYRWSGGRPEVAELFTPALEDLLGPRRHPGDALEQRHKDIAFSLQAVFEEAFFNLLEARQARTGLTDLVLSGGCAANSVANGKVLRRTKFKRLYVPPAPGDSGGAIGAAFSVWHKLHKARTFSMDHANWGPSFTDADIDAAIEARAPDLCAQGCRVERVSDERRLCAVTARSIADGLVVGWFQGRMEWGPRALGNRSIVGDPRRATMKDILNAKIKRRESFRPFAPSVLDTDAADWFEEDHPAPFMTQVYQIKAARRGLIPAITHADGSGRLQTVSRAANPRYFALIEAFRDLTGVPMVLNTSFNENEPVVCQPAEALDCFLRTRMDRLVLGDIIVERPPGLPAAPTA